MARRRYISTEISVDKRIAKLAESHGDFAALLYTWMIPHAGDDCTITGDPEELLMLVVPGLRSKTVEDVATALDAMVALNLIVPEGEDYYFPPDAFYRYQSYINAANRRRTPKNAEERRESPENAVSPPPSPSVTPSPSLSPPPPPPPSGRSAVKKAWESRIGVIPSADLEAFEEFEQTIPEEWFMQAIDETCKKADHPSWAYCLPILRRARETGQAPQASPGRKAPEGSARSQILARMGRS